MSKLDKEIVLKTLHGYAEVNRITEIERRARLQSITDEQALAAFEALNEDMIEINPEEKARLAKFRLKHHLYVRKAMEQLVKAQGYEPSI
jgi:hypothetical protein